MDGNIFDDLAAQQSSSSGNIFDSLAAEQKHPGETEVNNAVAAVPRPAPPVALTPGNKYEAAPNQPTPEERLGEMVPESAVPALAAAKKYAVDPFNKLSEAGGKVVGEAAERALFQEPPTPLNPQPPFNQAAVEKEFPITSGIAKGAGETVGSTLADPRNWPFFGASTARPILQKIIARGFAANLSYGAIEAAKQLHDNWDKLTPNQRAELGTQTGLGAAIAASSFHPRIGVELTPEGKAASGTVLGGAASAGVAVTPEEVVLRGGVGGHSGELRIPRPGAARAPQAPAIEPPTIEGTPLVRDAVEGARNYAQAEQVSKIRAGTAPAPPPPAPPPTPPAPQIPPEAVRAEAQKIETLPPEQRPAAVAQAHAELSSKLTEAGTVVTPDGKITTVKNPEQASRAAAKIINTEVSRLDKEAKEAEKAAPGPQEAPGATVEQPKTSEATKTPETQPTPSSASQPADIFTKLAKEPQVGDKVTLPDGRTGEVVFKHAKLPTIRVKADSGTPKQVSIGISQVRGLSQGTDEGNSGSAALQASTNGTPADVEHLSDLVQSAPFQEKGLGGLDVPTQRSVMRSVLTVLHDPKIREAVVKFVPVDVVDNLARLKDPSKIRLHDKNVLPDLLSRKFNGPVSIRTDVADSLLRGIASATTESSIVPHEGSARSAGVSSEGPEKTLAGEGAKESAGTAVANPVGHEVEPGTALGARNGNANGHRQTLAENGALEKGAEPRSQAVETRAGEKSVPLKSGKGEAHYLRTLPSRAAVSRFLSLAKEVGYIGGEQGIREATVYWSPSATKLVRLGPERTYTPETPVHEVIPSELGSRFHWLKNKDAVAVRERIAARVPAEAAKPTAPERVRAAAQKIQEPAKASPAALAQAEEAGRRAGELQRRGDTSFVRDIIAGSSKYVSTQPEGVRKEIIDAFNKAYRAEANKPPERAAPAESKEKPERKPKGIRIDQDRVIYPTDSAKQVMDKMKGLFLSYNRGKIVEALTKEQAQAILDTKPQDRPISLENREIERLKDKAGIKTPTLEQRAAVQIKVGNAEKIEPEEKVPEEGKNFEGRYVKAALEPVKEAWLNKFKPQDGEDVDEHWKWMVKNFKAADMPAEFSKGHLFIKVPDDGSFYIPNTPMAIDHALKVAEKFVPVKGETVRTGAKRFRMLSPAEFDTEKYITGLEKEVADLQDQIGKAGDLQKPHLEEQLKAARENLKEARQRTPEELAGEEQGNERARVGSGTGEAVSATPRIGREANGTRMESTSEDGLRRRTPSRKLLSGSGRTGEIELSAPAGWDKIEPEPQSLAKAESSYAPPDDVHPARVLLNPEGIALFNKATGKHVYGVRADLGRVSEYAAALRAFAMENPSLAKQADVLADALDKALKDADPERGVAIGDRTRLKTMTEEELHAWQVFAFRKNPEMPFSDVMVLPAFRTMEERLQEIEGPSRLKHMFEGTIDLILDTHPDEVIDTPEAERAIKAALDNLLQRMTPEDQKRFKRGFSGILKLFDEGDNLIDGAHYARTVLEAHTPGTGIPEGQGAAQTPSPPKSSVEGRLGSPGESSQGGRGISGPESDKGELNEQQPRREEVEPTLAEHLAGESGELNPAAGADRIARAAGIVGEYLRAEIKENKRARGIHAGMYELESQYQADVLRMVHTVEAVTKELGDKAKDDFQTVYDHLEDPEKFPLNADQDRVLDDVIIPLMQESDRIYQKLTEGGEPAENYVHRVVKDRGNFFDRILAGSKSIGRGNVLSKSAPQTKNRTMMALEEVPEETVYPNAPSTKPPQRVVVSIKHGKVTAWNKGQATDMGGLRSGLTTKESDMLDKVAPLNKRIRQLQHERRILSENPSRIKVTFERRKNISEEIDKLERERDSIINSVEPDELNNHEFIDRNGKHWKIVQATTREIEGNTDLRYYHNAMASAAVSFLQMRKAERGFDFINDLKNSPEFSDIAVKQGDGNPPEGWGTTTLPQLRGYYLEPHVREVMDWYADRIKGGDISVFDKIGHFLRTSIFFNPLLHIPNISVHWAVEKGVSGWAKTPVKLGRLYSTSTRAINAVMHQNQDFLDALDAGAPLQSQREDTQKLNDLFFEQLTDDLKSGEPWAERVAKSVGMSPINLVKAIYRFSGKATWVSNDIAFLQAAYEKVEDGMTLHQALRDTAKHIPDYRLPVRMLNSARLSKILSSPSVTMFMAYHYGALKSYGEASKSAFGGGESPRSKGAEVGHGWDILAMIGLTTFVLYPLLDKLARKATGDENTRVRRAGAATLPFNLSLLAKREKSAAEVAQSVVTPAVHTKTAIEMAVNHDLRTGRQIYDPTAPWRTQAEQIGNHLAQAVSPVQQYEQASRPGGLRRTLLGMAGISFPPRGAEKVAQEIAQQKYGTKAEDPNDDKQTRYLKYQILDDLRKGNRSSLEKAEHEGKISGKQAHTLEKRARMSPLLDTVTGRGYGPNAFTYPEVLRTFNAPGATDEQKNELRPILRQKREKMLERHRSADVEHAEETEGVAQ